MNDINSAILSSLTSGEKTRAQIAAMLNLNPPAVAGALVMLIGAGKVVVSGKALANRKAVSLYALSHGLPVQKSERTKKDTSPAKLEPLTNSALAELLNSNLYHIWGGFASVDQTASKKLPLRRHSQS